MQPDKTHTRKRSYEKKQIGELISGDVLLHPIFRSDGLMLINKDRVLDYSLIEKIKKHVLRNLPVLVSPTQTDFKNFLLHDRYNSAEFRQDLFQVMKEYGNVELKPEANQSEPETNSFIIALTSSPYWISLEKNLESEYLKKRIGSIKEELLTLFRNDQTFVDLCGKIKEYNDIIMIHTINTLCVSLILGTVLELTNEDLIELSVAALFVHVGYTQLPKEEFKSFLKSKDLNHPAMKKHFEIYLSASMESPYLRRKPIILGVLDHHEFYNGNGYPNGKKGEEISLFGRILHIAHAYDGLVGGYEYTSGVAPLDAIKLVYENKEGMFDSNILNLFMYRTTYFKLDSTVFLPDGKTGKIVGFENYITSPHRPIVQLENGRTVNLLREPATNA